MNKLKKLLKECGDSPCESGIKVSHNWDELLQYILKNKFQNIGFDLGNVIIDKQHTPDGKMITWDSKAYKETPEIEGAYKGLAKLSNDGRNLFIISRSHTSGDGVDGKVKALNWLSHNGIADLFDPKKIMFVDSPDDKAPIIDKLGLDAFIDDREDVVEDLTNTDTTPIKHDEDPSTDFPIDESFNVKRSCVRIFFEGNQRWIAKVKRKRRL